MNPRRLTPSMSLLLAFEAAGRHGSFTKAAGELALTQSAVSRQVQALEALLEVALFRREGRHIALTAAGALYQHELAGALARIRGATLQTISHRIEADTLHLAVLPTFASKWLMPRMGDFYGRHPGSLVHLHSRIVRGDLSDGVQDMSAIICAGSGQWPGYVAHRLLSEKLVVVASPKALPAHAQMSVQEAGRQLLLGVVSRPHAWSDWFASVGLTGSSTPRLGPSFEHTAHLIQAVIAGIGIGLVPRILVQDEIAQGELVTLFEPMESGRGYYLAYPTHNQQLPALVAFREWLLSIPFPDS
ncbi:LysR substrate-binding domain-containing protein [Pseudomonas coleopterorum]|uniref:LysR family transcriptional regulator n=1 Tax=Pseudomonas coleopterorum TaxID=1605838 RepID=A0ABR9BU79_9PSED|nr:LysR substrate-binding domain-containing protein [Pseudomonas coleopterorum]MBD8754415.1 LysR family transcriptional regulator [Pseudomonas coleopterorum]MBD8768589.1 LysR family transcriptional regulator [Pseudomonas coleopterorum]